MDGKHVGGHNAKSYDARKSNKRWVDKELRGLATLSYAVADAQTGSCDKVGGAAATDDVTDAGQFPGIKRPA